MIVGDVDYGSMTDDMVLWLLTKPAPRLTGRRCVQRRFAELGGAAGLEGFTPVLGAAMHRCSRPQWGDGRGITAGGGMIGEGMCSRCLHEHVAFHSAYTTMAANPAASQLSGASILRRSDIFGRAGGSLPEVGAHGADVFPEDWNIHA